jgi:hypothetical protein
MTIEFDNYNNLDNGALNVLKTKKRANFGRDVFGRVYKVFYSYSIFVEFCI